jgi:formamidopyrimidine-DNA glycosylase
VRTRLNRADIVTPVGIDLASLLAGRSVRDLDRRGKRIIFTLDNGCRFFIHLGMTGRLTISSAKIAPEPHTHLEIELSKQGKKELEVLRFRDPRRFGGIWWLGCETSPDKGMGPEPLTLTPTRLSAILLQTTRPLKVSLLDQKLVAGLGNIYVDESLFLAKIHPLQRSRDQTATQARALMRAMKTTLKKAIDHRGSTLRDYRDAEGNAGGFQSLHQVYDREGEPCVICKTPIERIVLGGRSTHFCPKCQPAATKTTRRR